MKITAIPGSRRDVPAYSGLTARAPDFVALMKPRVMLLAVFTALVGSMIAPGHFDPLLSTVAIAAGAGAAGVLDMWYDADIVQAEALPRLIRSARGFTMKAHEV